MKTVRAILVRLAWLLAAGGVLCGSGLLCAGLWDGWEYAGAGLLLMATGTALLWMCERPPAEPACRHACSEILETYDDLRAHRTGALVVTAKLRCHRCNAVRLSSLVRVTAPEDPQS